MAYEEFKVGKRFRVTGFYPDEHMASRFVDVSIGDWNEVRSTMKLSPDEARELSAALANAADAASRPDAPSDLAKGEEGL